MTFLLLRRLQEKRDVPVCRRDGCGPRVLGVRRPHAEAVRSFIRGLRRARIIPAHLEHFALHHTQDHAMRQLVSNTWKTHRGSGHVADGTAKAWGKLAQRDVKVHAVFGDRATPSFPGRWSRPWRNLGNSHVHFLRSIPVT